MVKRLVTVIGIAMAGVGVARLVQRFRSDDATARARLAAVDRRVAATSSGDVEYAEDGDGSPLLVVHGIFGGRDAGLLAFGGLLADRRVIAPSRFGYLGSALPAVATPAMQAGAFAELLDHLGVDRVDVMGYSAGSTSVVHARDDTLAPFAPAGQAAGRIPGARLVALERGGHLMLGQRDLVGAEVGAFLTAAGDT